MCSNVAARSSQCTGRLGYCRNLQKGEFKPEIMSLGCPAEPLQGGVLRVLNTSQGERTQICSEGFF